MKRANSNRPSTEPWGTPTVTGAQEEKSSDPWKRWSARQVGPKPFEYRERQAEISELTQEKVMTNRIEGIGEIK